LPLVSNQYIGPSLVSKYADDNHRAIDNEEEDHHVRIHVETPYRKSDTPPTKTKLKTTTKRQIFQLTPFPKLIPKTKLPGEQKTVTTKQNESKQKETQIQKRDRFEPADSGTRVPIFAESNLGIVHDRHKEEVFETFEKKHNILKIQKRLANEWNGPRGTVHGRSVQRNPIVQLLRSAAGKKSQKILGLNSKSFDIFPGPMPGEDANGNMVKAQARASYQPRMREYNPQVASENAARRQQAGGAGYFQEARQGFRSFQQQPPQRSFQQPPQNKQYGGEYPEQVPIMRSMRTMGSYGGPAETAQPSNYPSVPHVQRRYNAPAPRQRYTRPQRVARQSFLPPPPLTPMPEQAEIGRGMGRAEEFFQPNDPSPGIRNSLSRFSPAPMQPVNGLQERITAYRNGLEGDAQEQDSIIQDQINQISQDEGAQYRGDNKLLQVSPQEMQTLPYAAENGVANDFPKMVDPGPAAMLPQEEEMSPYGGNRATQPAYFMKPQLQPQQAQMEEDDSLRRQMLAEESGHTRTIPQAYQQQMIQSQQQSQLQQFQPQLQQQQLAPMVGEGVGAFPHTSQLHARGGGVGGTGGAGGRAKPQGVGEEEDDEEKPEVHVHISTEKRKEIAKPAKDDDKKTNVKSP